MKFKHVDTCWYYGKLDHRGMPYEWPCCGETTECDSNYVDTLKAENARFKSALSRLAADRSDTCCECDDVKEIAREALEEK